MFLVFRDTCFKKDAMAKFSVTVEVVHAYLVEVEANDERAAVDEVDHMLENTIKKRGEFIDTHIEVDDEPERLA